MWRVRRSPSSLLLLLIPDRFVKRQAGRSDKVAWCLFPRWHHQRDLLNEALGSLLSDLYIPDFGQDVSSGKYVSFVF